MVKIGRNDPCFCGSGIKYKKCHGACNEGTPDEKYRISQKTYIDLWRNNSILFYNNDDYAWMANIASDGCPKRILDIGCGAGLGIKSLIQKLGTEICIIGLDENPYCLEASACEIRSTGMNVNIIDRFRPRADADNECFRIEYDVCNIEIISKGCTLIGSAVFSDRYIEKLLVNSDKFDLITVWLIGSHIFMPLVYDLINRGINSDYEYRLFIQRNIYSLANILLKKGGRLNIVDRAFNSDGWQEIIKSIHIDLASNTDLIVGNPVCRSYDPSAVNGGVPMIYCPRDDGKEQGEPVLVSITSVKP